MRINVTVRGPAHDVDVVAECDDALPVGRLTEALRVETGLTLDHEAGDPALARPDVPVGEAGLRNGMVLSMVPGGSREGGLTTEGWQLHVVGGPGAGHVFSLPVGRHEVGRSGDLAWGDQAMSRRHAAVEVTEEEVRVVDLGSANGTVLHGETVDTEEPVVWPAGDLLEMGDSLVELRAAHGPDAAVEEAEPGWLNFLRPPRIRALHLTPTVEVPKAPGERRTRRIPVIAMIAPMVFGITLALVMRSPFYLMFALMSPIMMGANYWSERRGSAKDHRQAVEEYTEKLAAAQTDLERKIASEQRRLRHEMPDAAETLRTAALPGRRLWERRRHDVDALVLRWGSTDLPSTVKLTGEEVDEEHTLRAVPVGVGLAQAGVVGIAGPEEKVNGLVRWSVVQLAAYHAPRDLSLSFVSLRAGSEWNWLRWLPHLRPDDPDSAVAHVGNDESSATALVAALADLVKERRGAADNSSSVHADSFPAHVVVVHGYRQVRGLPGMRQLLEDGPAVGVYAICTDDEERSLPERCTATFLVDPGQATHGTLHRSGEPTLESVLLDVVSATYADRVARALAPLKDVGSQQGDDSLPDSARLLEVLQLDDPTPDELRSRWMLEPRSTTMVLGVGAKGPFSLDLRSDGPHGLVAGMTGSGKTELLQTMIASLAIANRPDALNFVLVDYKGDSAFKECVKLPHTVGKVNDLDPHLVQRALASLGAELKHREHFLAEAEVKDIEDYQDLCLREPHRPPLPRLLIVIDEFAQLSKDLPEFVSGLVSIAQLGRSLGIHLVLATQRPSGVVSPEIRANTNLRIALRVADVSDSSDVIGAPDSARIPKSAPGRAYARTGASSLQGFQAGRVGGRRPGAVAVEVPPPFVCRVGWESVGYAVPRPLARGSNEEVADTDLAALVRAVVTAAEEEQVPEQRRPWLPPLPEQLLADDVWTSPQAPTGLPPLPFGRVDLPALQQQRAAAFDLTEDGHLLVIGSSKSGRSQLLRAVAASVARLTDPADVHLYGLDCGNGALNPLAELPHCGAVVSRTEPERAARLLSRITDLMDDRQRLMSQEGFGDISEQRAASAEPLPHLLLLLDRWEGFMTTIGEVDALFDAMTRILREGASLGVHAVITGDRTLGSNSRVATMTDNKLALRLADRSDYGLVGLNPRTLPERVPAGRGFTPDGSEVQVMLLDADDSGQAQGAALRRLAAQAPRAREGHRPFRVDVLPSRPTVEQALALPPHDRVGPRLLVGVGGDDLQAYEVDLTRAPSFVVAGPGRSGRSSVLLGAAEAYLATGGQVIAVAPRPSPLRDLAGREGVLGVVTDPATPASAYVEMVEGATGRVLVLLDDGEQLRDSGGNDFFLDVVRGRRDDAFLLVAGNVDGLSGGISGWNVEARKSRQGLLLSPQGLSDGDLVGVRLPRNVIGRPVRAGRGWLHQGDGELVQVATLS
ncbi:FHA domain-containing protein [Nocardioides sp. Y6]|uniref:FHA domain-containing protein n=1 Tax=Nocardioides malaquae TaxID=2773426 RepID=A0ABR9RRN4_9ACTN|nr:FtsK/SpoIIIE domain-containing protein [Nocardioides malaquae]MBE7324219.1 FHA domain-containing protein [Nocardioides malaquae]